MQVILLQKYITLGEIMNNENEPQKQAKDFPPIISASRATDIPAFHAKWFMERLNAGYCAWNNPFNKKQHKIISFEKTKTFIFWSKNPTALMPHLQEIEKRGYQFYFQYTLNDYTAEGLEPKIPALGKRIATFKKLSDAIGKHRVIWRFDPIILSDTLSKEVVLERINHIGTAIAPYTEKLVFSFVDMYRKTQNALKKIDTSLRAPTPQEMQELASGICELNKGWQTPLQLATCAEAIDRKKLGIIKNKCIDDDLILRLCPNDPFLQTLFYKQADCPGQLSLLSPIQAGQKDSGQRKPCGCIKSKDIGQYSTCMHLCAYCYANQSEKVVIATMNKRQFGMESILG